MEGAAPSIEAEGDMGISERCFSDRGIWKESNDCPKRIIKYNQGKTKNTSRKHPRQATKKGIILIVLSANFDDEKDIIFLKRNREKKAPYL